MDMVSIISDMAEGPYGVFGVWVYITGSHDDAKAVLEVEDWLARMDAIQEALEALAEYWTQRLDERWPGSRVVISTDEEGGAIAREERLP